MLPGKILRSGWNPVGEEQSWSCNQIKKAIWATNDQYVRNHLQLNRGEKALVRLHFNARHFASIGAWSPFWILIWITTSEKTIHVNEWNRKSDRMNLIFIQYSQSRSKYKMEDLRKIRLIYSPTVSSQSCFKARCWSSFPKWNATNLGLDQAQLFPTDRPFADLDNDGRFRSGHHNLDSGLFYRNQLGEKNGNTSSQLI